MFDYKIMLRKGLYALLDFAVAAMIPALIQYLTGKYSGYIYLPFILSLVRMVRNYLKHKEDEIGGVE